MLIFLTTSTLHSHQRTSTLPLLPSTISPYHHAHHAHHSFLSFPGSLPPTPFPLSISPRLPLQRNATQPQLHGHRPTPLRHPPLRAPRTHPARRRRSRAASRARNTFPKRRVNCHGRHGRTGTEYAHGHVSAQTRQCARMRKGPQMDVSPRTRRSRFLEAMRDAQGRGRRGGKGCARLRAGKGSKGTIEGGGTGTWGGGGYRRLSQGRGVD